MFFIWVCCITSWNWYTFWISKLFIIVLVGFFTLVLLCLMCNLLGASWLQACLRDVWKQLLCFLSVIVLKRHTLCMMILIFCLVYCVVISRIFHVSIAALFVNSCSTDSFIGFIYIYPYILPFFNLCFGCWVKMQKNI